MSIIKNKERTISKWFVTMGDDYIEAHLLYTPPSGAEVGVFKTSIDFRQLGLSCVVDGVTIADALEEAIVKFNTPGFTITVGGNQEKGDL